MNAAAHPFDPSALSLPKQRKNTSAPRATKLASAMVGYDRLPAAQSTDTAHPAGAHLGQPEGRLHWPGALRLDPATPENGMPWPTAARMLKPSDDGTASEWPADAFVFMNPPFGRGKRLDGEDGQPPGRWHRPVFARTETKWFQRFVLNHPNISAVVFRRAA